MKDYQTKRPRAATLEPEIVLPETVHVAMVELAADVREGLLALAVGAGLQVLQALLEESVTAVAGPKGRHDPNRVAVGHGREAGSVTLGGRRVGVRRPRVRTQDGSVEVAVLAYELFASTSWWVSSRPSG